MTLPVTPVTPATPATPVNSSFSTKMPGLQLGVDSTSLGTFKTCPRKYQLSIVEGWRLRAESVHLTFGLLLHSARESYDHLRMSDMPHEEALLETVHLALKNTWNRELKRPWISDHPGKNRLSLIRTIVWYLDTLGQNDPIETRKLANGRPAVELSFRYDSGLRAVTGEPIIFCGHLDRIGQLNGDNYIVDIKTTLHSLSPNWFQSFTPDNQFSMYTLAGKIAFGIDIKGVIVDGIQIGATFSRFQRGLIPRDNATVDEWFRDTGNWIEQMSHCADFEYWPMNDKSCSMYGGCEFREVCSRTPAARQLWLQKNYVKRVWDPLISRGDI